MDFGDDYIIGISSSLSLMTNLYISTNNYKSIKMRKILTLISVLIFSNLNSQIASMEAYVIQDGKDGYY